MDEELTRLVNEAAEIKKSGRWGAVNQKIRQLADNISEHQAWQIQVMASLCTQNFSEYLALKKAYEEEASEPSLLAWRARNLFEISIWSIYCAQSEKNARVFYKEAGQDVIDSFNAFTKWGKATSQSDDWLNSFEMAQQDISKRAASEGIKSLDGAYKRIGEIAKACDMGQHYGLSYKILSKFSHPTAMLILATPDHDKEILQKNMFYGEGCMFFVGGFTALEGVLSCMAQSK